MKITSLASNSKILRRNLGLIFILIFILSIFIIYRSSYNAPSDCDLLTKTATNWEVRNSTEITANVPWQRTVIGSGMVFYASNDHILYYQQILGCIDDEHIISLDINTGEVDWTYPARLVRAITSYESNYIITQCCTDILLLNNLGQLVWEAQSLPVRIYRPHLSVINSSLYFPAITSVYNLSLSDGTVVETIDMNDVAYFWDDVAIVNVSERSLELVNLQTHQTEWTTEVFDQRGSSNFSVYRFENVIIVTWGISHIVGYDIGSGEKLWEIDQDFSAVPVVIEGNVFAYSVDNVLNIYDVLDGREVGQLTLNRTSTNSGISRATEDELIQLGGTYHNLYIYYPATSELLLLDFEFSAEENSTGSP